MLSTTTNKNTSKKRTNAMQEQLQNTATKTTTNAGGLGDVFGDNSPFATTVTVRHGVHTEQTHANQTVGEVRERLRDRLGLSDQATAFVDGNSHTLHFSRGFYHRIVCRSSFSSKNIYFSGSDNFLRIS